VSDRIRVFDIPPTPAPRQSRRDAWAPSKAVLRYRAFRDEVALKIKELPEDFFHVVFLIPVPASWSQKKKLEHIGTPHTGKPDKDNLEKALVDAVYRNRDDGHVWNTASTKLWSGYPAIIIADDYLPFYEIPVDLGELVRGSWDVYDRVIV
jgi:Holliday junction resolvase RusA-like endonuclease